MALEVVRDIGTVSVLMDLLDDRGSPPHRALEMGIEVGDEDPRDVGARRACT
jgi:hypothetical protein